MQRVGRPALYPDSLIIEVLLQNIRKEFSLNELSLRYNVNLNTIKAWSKRFRKQLEKQIAEEKTEFVLKHSKKEIEFDNKEI